MNKKADIVRVYLPPDANCLLSVADHCLRSRHYVNVIVAGKQPALQWLNIDSAIKHCTTGIGIWEWASTDNGAEPDAVMICAGDVPTLETLAAVDLLRQHFPDIRIRVVNVVDLMKRMVIRSDPSWNAKASGGFPCTVRLTTRDGQESRSEIAYASGHARNKMNKEQVIAKFYSCVDGRLTTDQAENR